MGIWSLTLIFVIFGSGLFSATLNYTGRNGNFWRTFGQLFRSSLAQSFPAEINGFLISTLFRDAMQQLIRNVRVETNRTYNNSYKEFSRENIVYVINETNFNQIFNRDKFKEHFNGRLKIGNIGGHHPLFAINNWIVNQSHRHSRHMSRTRTSRTHTRRRLGRFRDRRN